MSADNGIYIGVFDDCIKVIHKQAIENCDYDDNTPKEVTDWYRVIYFKDAETFLSISDAMKCALKLKREVLEWAPLEYGMQTIHYGTPLLDLTVTKAQEKLDAYWDVEIAKARAASRCGDGPILMCGHGWSGDWDLGTWDPGVGKPIQLESNETSMEKVATEDRRQKGT